MSKKNYRPNNPSRQNQVITEKRSAFYQGPIPMPSILEGYNKLVPDAAERIIKIAENQSAHRIEIEKQIINSNVVNERLGVIFAFIIVLVAVTGGIIVILNDKSAEGVALIISSLGTLAGVFIAGKYYQKKALANSKNKDS